uniref:CMP/dCMP-type deaminase domain-containing protein n=1 Tax=Chrysemys picta bellii TaxID=8478 RepID=A0A8C3HWB9_CHRPI
RGRERAPSTFRECKESMRWETFIDSYDPSVLRRVQYMLYEIKWSNSKRPWQSCCHSTRMEHAEIHFIEDVFQEQRSDPSAHCSITWYMSWSPCGYCCKQIRDFLKDQPNVNLVIYVARIYWHKREINRQGLRSLMNIGVSIRVMDLPAYSYCWRTFVNDEDKDEDDYWPRHFAPWIMLYSLELQSILQVSGTLGRGKVHPEMIHSRMQNPFSELDISLASFEISLVL